jgi:hypothetical protein
MLFASTNNPPRAEKPGRSIALVLGMREVR